MKNTRWFYNGEHFISEDGERTADHKRIIACLNAMEGIDDPAAARVLLDDPKTEAAADMLFALQEILNWIRGLPADTPKGIQLRLARDAMMKAKGHKL